MTPLVSVVVPAFNEGTRLGASLKRITSYFRSQSIEFEIIVVSDGSTDETAAVARAGGDAVKLVELLRNQGKGAAVRNGVLESQGQHILFTYADLSTPIEQWIQIHEKLGEGYDVVIGSRAHAESNIEVRQPWYRERMGKIFNWILRCILPLKLKDTQVRLQTLRVRDGETTIRSRPRRRLRVRRGNPLPRKTIRLLRR